MLQVSLAGRLGRDAEAKNVSGTDVCSFVVAVDVGYGERKQTYWIDCSKWGKGSDRLAGFLTKGTSVAVSGELTTREHKGKTYLQCRANSVTLQGGNAGGQQQRPQQQQQPSRVELDDEIPF